VRADLVLLPGLLQRRGPDFNLVDPEADLALGDLLEALCRGDVLVLRVLEGLHVLALHPQQLEVLRSLVSVDLSEREGGRKEGKIREGAMSE
jgi:hypothetical protein